MRLHVLGLPHTQTTNASQVCAFTQKVVKFGKMMTDQGYEVIIYAGEENEAVCTEHVTCVTKEQQRKWYGEFDPNTLPTIASFDVNAAPWVEMNKKVIEEIKKRIEPGDIICLTMGTCQKPIADAFPKNIHCEWAVGYEGIFSNFCCFESYAWMHNRYAAYGINDGRFYDTVIPNFFFTEQFSLGSDGGYLLFVGRITQRKGIHVAAEIAKHAEKKLLVAGPGVVKHEVGRIVGDGGAYVVECPGMEYVGILNPESRNKVMSEATALIVPTIYIEPFGAVAVEAMLCGTPAITTDWGAFPETVTHGSNGYRFRTLAEGVEAVRQAEGWGVAKRRFARLYTQDRYSIEKVGPRFDRWFKNLSTLYGAGWYAGT